MGRSNFRNVIQTWHICRCALALLFLLIALDSAALAQNPSTELTVSKVGVIGKLFPEFDQEKAPAENVSGIVCGNSGVCHIVADEFVAVQSARLNVPSSKLKAGQTFTELFERVCPEPADDTTCAEFDLEGIAQVGQRIYMTGSMGVSKSKGEQEAARWTLIAVDVDDNGAPADNSLRVIGNQTHLKKVFQDARLKRFIDRPLQCGGINVEGLAADRESLYFGLRSPSDRKSRQGFIVEARIEAMFATRYGSAVKSIVHAITFDKNDGSPARNIGIRAIEKFGKSFIIATGDAGVSLKKKKKKRKKQIRKLKRKCAGLLINGELGNVKSDEPVQPEIWYWTPGTSRAVFIAAIGVPYADQKLEGLAVANRRGNRADLVLTFDNPDSGLSSFAILKDVTIN